ncbi:hypothetical protein [Thorsellia kenyensis]|uniref:Uncharacterized protein n=1 Tax=Thorsellia kenyensis TaxID=1549888 RepID=A0ABV6CAZ5_9GAMM
MSQLNHKFAQDLLSRDGIIQQFVPVDLGDAKDWKTKNRILRHFEQKEINKLTKTNKYNVQNRINAEAPKKSERNAKIVLEYNAKPGNKITCGS